MMGCRYARPSTCWLPRAVLALVTNLVIDWNTAIKRTPLRRYPMVQRNGKKGPFDIKCSVRPTRSESSEWNAAVMFDRC